MLQFQNMSFMSACLSPPCAAFQAEWTTAQAQARGWTRVWGTDAANAVQGTDGTQFARPLSESQLLVFVDTLYRACVRLLAAPFFGFVLIRAMAGMSEDLSSRAWVAWLHMWIESS